MSQRKPRRPPFKACRECHALVPRDATRCPYCGSTDLTEEWEGVLIILKPDKTLLKRYVNIEKPGRYAIRVE